MSLKVIDFAAMLEKAGIALPPCTKKVTIVADIDDPNKVVRINYETLAGNDELQSLVNLVFADKTVEPYSPLEDQIRELQKQLEEMRLKYYEAQAKIDLR